MASKVVPQGIQKIVRKELIEAVNIGNDAILECSFRPTDSDTLLVKHYDEGGNELGEYEVLFVVIPKQADIHTEVRNG